MEISHARQPALRLFVPLLATAILLSGCVSAPGVGGRGNLRVSWRQAPYTTTLPRVVGQEMGSEPDDIPNCRCTMGAHRGSSLLYTENTLAALLAAEDDPGYAFIEFDVQFTSDRQVVLFHDRTLFRLFGSLQRIRKATYKELLVASDGNIVRLEEVLPQLHKRLIIEIKEQGDAAVNRLLVDAVMNILQSHGRAKDVMLSSISDDIVLYVKTAYPQMATGQVFWLTAATYLHLQSLTECLYAEVTASKADYLLIHVSSLHNWENLLKLKPPNHTLVFWDFDDHLYLVHRDMNDKLWGTSNLTEWLGRLRFLVR